MFDKITVIDIGSGSLKASVFSDENGNLKLLSGIAHEIKICSRIGSVICNENIDQILIFLKKVLNLSASHNSARIIAVATQAARKSPNFSHVSTKIFDKTGINVRTITGVEEAELIANNIRKTMRIDRFVSFDLGCGSIELAEFDTKILNSWSLPLSVLNFNKLENFEEIEKKIKTSIEAVNFYSSDIADFPLIGSGGVLRLANFVISHNTRDVLTACEIRSLLNDLQNKRNEERFSAIIPKERIEIFPIGLLIILNLMNHMGVQEVFVAKGNLRSSIALEYFNTRNAKPKTQSCC